jgi:hypothetical protein
MLTHLPCHRKSDPLWRKHRLQPRTAFSRFPPIRSLTLEGQLWVDLTPSPSRRGMAGICALPSAWVSAAKDRFLADAAQVRRSGF